MKRTKRLILLLFAVFLLGGCGKNQEESESGYVVYYVNSAGTSLIGQTYDPKAETFDEMMTELLGQLAEAPSGAAYVSAIQEGAQVQGYERGIDALRIDFSEEYYAMSNTQEVLARAAVVKTICQIPGVTKIMITVDGEQLKDAQGDAVAAMDAESFIDTKNGGINSYQYASLELYFPDSSGTELVKEVRKLHYSSNMTLERVVVEQVLKGASDNASRTAFSSSVQILDISTKNGICTINFDSAFSQTPTENAASAEASLYAIVDSLCETIDDITGVQFRIEGESGVQFRDEIDLNQVFEMNTEIFAAETEETEETKKPEETVETEEAEETEETEKTEETEEET